MANKKPATSLVGNRLGRCVSLLFGDLCRHSTFATMKPFSAKEKVTATALRKIVELSLPLEEYRDDPHVRRTLEALEAATTSLAFVHYRDLSGAVRQSLFRSDI